MATPVCVIDENGITAPTYADVKTYFDDAFKGIYGQDIVIDPDSQDGQLIAIFSAAVHDANSMAVAVYNAFSPVYAQGVGLSSVVKINGIARSVSTKSTVDLRIIGIAGTQILNGKAQDSAGYYWSLPVAVLIPVGGEVVVTATCDTIGAISAAIGGVSIIATPTRGWQSVTNLVVATTGNAVESDAALRIRQKTSVAIPSNSILEGIVGAVADLPGVERYRAYENDTDATDANGIPSHSISLVVDGGDALQIATTIADKKGPGCGTYGTTSQVVTDKYGVPHTIRLYRPTEVPITVEINLTPLTGYTATIRDEIIAAVIDYINGMGIGNKLYFTRLYVPANLSNSESGATFDLNSVQVSRDGNPVAPSDIAIAFNEAASTNETLVTIVVS